MISVICSVFNEEKFIENIILFFLRVNPIDKELLVLDGGSTDCTKSIVSKYIKTNPNIRLIDNPQKYVAFALNKGIKESVGDIIIRIDAHSEYADDYFEKILETFNEVEADVVGGPCRTKSESSFQEAVALAISNPLGTGGSKNHDENFRGYTDHTTFGAWKRDLFKTVGYFDERLVRNQDDEFDYRAKSMGKKIFQNPEIKLWYYPRSTPKGLAKQYFQYGYYKPLVLKKVKTEIKLRHLIPSIFSTYIFSLPLTILSPLYLTPLCLYFLLIFGFSLSVSSKFKVKLSSFAVFPIIHLSYGTGFILGILKKHNG